jgi:N-acetylneuraminate synthase
MKGKYKYMKNHVYIIAEAGVNHNGDLDTAFRLVDAAVDAGVDAVKFQTFKTENLVTKTAKKASYQKNITDVDESQFSMLKKLELSRDMHFKLADYCNKNNIEFLSTAFDFNSLEFLVKDLKLQTLKLSSGDITNGPFLLEHAKANRNIILSTGMATIDEVKEALGVLAFGYIGIGAPSLSAFKSILATDEAISVLREKVTLLHCTTEYPAPMFDINLRAMNTLEEVFKLRVGYSDHSEGITVPIAAVARGAMVIEKHITLDRSMHGPDHYASIEPEELKNMVKAIRDVEIALGDGVKVPRPSELGNRDVARKSLVVSDNVLKGEAFNEKNLTIKRPGTGISPMKYWTFLGNISERNINSDEVI